MLLAKLAQRSTAAGGVAGGGGGRGGPRGMRAQQEQRQAAAHVQCARNSLCTRNAGKRGHPGQCKLARSVAEHAALTARLNAAGSAAPAPAAHTQCSKNSLCMRPRGHAGLCKLASSAEHGLLSAAHHCAAGEGAAGSAGGMKARRCVRGKA